jgi:hypothetical protein
MEPIVEADMVNGRLKPASDQPLPSIPSRALRLQRVTVISRMVRQHETSDAQLRIGESQDSQMRNCAP